jgi:DNA-nicking Smr family endonuclease
MPVALPHAKAPVRRAAPITAPTALPTDKAKPRAGPGVTLDASWDRQIKTGAVVPDRIVDLHGDTLERAHARIDAELAAATAAGDRVILLITGKPGGTRPGTGRGAIRAVVGDWLAASRHAGRIAAVRPAHRRHGGAGALYLILRRR